MARRWQGPRSVLGFEQPHTQTGGSTHKYFMGLTLLLQCLDCLRPLLSLVSAAFAAPFSGPFAYVLHFPGQTQCPSVPTRTSCILLLKLNQFVVLTSPVVLALFSL